MYCLNEIDLSFLKRKNKKGINVKAPICIIVENSSLSISVMLKWYFFFLCYVCLSFNAITANGLQLKEVGDFYHKCSYEERMFVEPQNCHTNH